MYPAVNARVGDVVGDLPERGVLQDDGGHRGVHQGNRVSRFAVETSHNLGRPTARTAMIGGIAWETWSRDEWSPVRINIGFRIAVSSACMDRRFGTPKIGVLFVQATS